jgi:3-dehydroquinate synthetase
MSSELIYLKKPDLYKELESFPADRFYAVADEKIKDHLPPGIQKSKNIFWLKNPEQEKTLSSYGAIIEFLLSRQIDRTSIIHGIGGGATTDLAGFVAATILRGIKWRAVPTTLLAMIDGSLGGKVAVNSPSGKNLIGAFHHPEKIFVCSEFLTSLAEENWISGKGEIIKYGFLSEKIYELIMKKADIGEIARACAEYKMEVVKKDFREQGERVYLNLGHTLGHAFESSLKIPHGLAVAMGMATLFQIMGKDTALGYWEKMVTALSLPRERLKLGHYQISRKKIDEYLSHDKKRENGKLKLILTDGPGKISVQEISLSELSSRMNAHDDLKDK